VTTIQSTQGRDVLPAMERHALGPVLEEIDRLKSERNAIVLAHNYMTPAVYHLAADLQGDSLALAQMASETDAEVIVMAGVHFMAETAKVSNPNKTVLIPDLEAGCSLAESITAADVRRLREQHPGVPVVTYVNTSAEVKAESDVCCTSGNAVSVVESLGSPRVLFLPDQWLGRWVASQTDTEILLWDGACEVHERFGADDIRRYRSPGMSVMAHPECPTEVLAEADYVGSTHGMINWVRERRPQQVMMLTECSMADNVAVEVPETDFVRPCNLCPHMQRIDVENIARSLRTMTHEVTVDEEVAERAQRAVERMLAVGRR
jgi:quinolinate synthase